MGGVTYLDLDLLFTQSESGYQVQVLQSPAGEGQAAVFDAPFTDLELENFALKVGRSRVRTRRVDAPPVAAAKDVGSRLYRAVFANAVHECLRRSLDHARDENAQLRIRLRLSDCPELANLPWEMLYDQGDDWFIALSNATPVVRYIQLPDPPRAVHVTLPLKVLVIRSEPADCPKLDLDAEWAQVADALRELTGAGAIAFTELVSPTMSELRRALLRDSFHVLHYMGHGGFDEHNGGVLLFTDRAGYSVPVTAGDLGVLLHDHTAMRLAVLNACEGARTDPGDPFAGVAETLVRRGIPAVVAMQFEFSDDAAIEFAPALYGALAEGLTIDAAVGEARKAVYTVSPLEWATPVLYLRAADGQLFDIARDKRPTSSGAETRKTAAPAPLSEPSDEQPADTPAEATTRIRLNPNRAAVHGSPPDDPANQRRTVGTALITVSRRADGRQHKNTEWTVLIDGKKVGKIRQGQRCEYQVSAGTHSVQLKIFYYSSSVESASLNVGDSARFTCGLGHPISFRSSFSAATWKQEIAAPLNDTFIKLERE